MYIDYVGIRVTRLPAAIRFFSRALGLREVRRGKMRHGGVWVLLEDPTSHQRLELNWYPSGSKYATPFTAGEALDHIGVRVQKYPVAARRLRAAGARPVEEIRYRGEVALGYFEGPDGLWIELIVSPSD